MMRALSKWLLLVAASSTFSCVAARPKTECAAKTIMVSCRRYEHDISKLHYNRCVERAETSCAARVEESEARSDAAFDKYTAKQTKKERERLAAWRKYAPLIASARKERVDYCLAGIATEPPRVVETPSHDPRMISSFGGEYGTPDCAGGSRWAEVCAGIMIPLCQIEAHRSETLDIIIAAESFVFDGEESLIYENLDYITPAMVAPLRPSPSDKAFYAKAMDTMRRYDACMRDNEPEAVGTIASARIEYHHWLDDSVMTHSNRDHRAAFEACKLSGQTGEQCNRTVYSYSGGEAVSEYKAAFKAVQQTCKAAATLPSTNNTTQGN